MKWSLSALLAIIGCFWLLSCNSETVEEKKAPTDAEPEVFQEADYIEVQHILLGFPTAVGWNTIRLKRPVAPGQKHRNRQDTEKLARAIKTRAENGEDFVKMMKEYTFDAVPGIYGMTNRGVAPRGSKTKAGHTIRPRDGMVGAFGNVGFKLKVGEIGIADYDPTTSPYGIHIIKRIL